RWNAIAHMDISMAPFSIYTSSSASTDPAGNDTTYTFRDCTYETQRQVFQGSSTTGTLLQTVQTQYQSFVNGFNVERPIDFPTTVTTIWPNGASLASCSTTIRMEPSPR